jgi:hypothetical protein
VLPWLIDTYSVLESLLPLVNPELVFSTTRFAA